MKAVNVPEITAVEIGQHLIAALVYVVVAAAALVKAPRDRRTQVFFALSMANAIAFGVTVYGWFIGLKNPMEMNKPLTGLSLAALGVGGLLLFHFSQVFPRRRPWIATSGVQMPLAYVLTPAIIMALAFVWPSDPAKLTLPFVGLMLVFGFPLLVLLGFVLPVAAVLSLVKSYREADAISGLPDARPVIAAILLSQVAGGVLALVFAPLLGVAAPNSLLLKMLTTTIWALSLLTPLAFAAGVWKYRLLDSPEVQP